jgi:hypothetical protein
MSHQEIPFKIKLGTEVYPITVKVTINDNKFRITAHVPNNYPRTPVIVKMQESRDFKYKHKGSKTIIACVIFNTSSVELYLQWFFVYMQLYPQLLLPEEKSGIKGLGRYMVCIAVNLITKNGMYKPTIELSASGGRYIKTKFYSLNDSIKILKNFRRRYYDDFIKQLRNLNEEHRKEEIIRHASDLENNLKLIDYYSKTFGFRVKDKKQLNHFYDYLGIDLIVSTDIFLKHCN